MNTVRAVKFEISGRVQGVGYRWYVLSNAEELGIKGSVKNNMDGSVTVIAQGEVFQIKHLKMALQKGPQLARISEIKEVSIDLTEALNEFKVIY